MEPLTLPQDSANDFFSPAATRRAFSRVGLGLSACLLGGSCILLAVLYFLPDNLHQDVLILLNALCVDVGGKLLAIAFMHRLPDAHLEKKSLSVKEFLVFAAMAYGLMLLGNYMGTGLMLLMNSGAENPLSSVVTLENMSLLTVLDLILFAPVLEEMLFRKLLLKKTARWGTLPAMVFSALVFGLFHGNFYQFFYAFFLGMLLAYVYLSTGNLLYPILLHAFVNTLGSVVPLGLMAAEASLSLEAAYTLETAVSLMLLGLGVFGLVMLIRRRKQVQLSPCPQRDAIKWMYLNPGVIFFLLLCAALMAAATFGFSLH